MLLNFHGSFVFVASRFRLQQLLQDITFKTVCQQLFYFVLLSFVFLTCDSLYRLSHSEASVNNFFIFLCVYVSGLIRRSASFDRASDIILNQSSNVNDFLRQILY